MSEKTILICVHGQKHYDRMRFVADGVRERIPDANIAFLRSHSEVKDEHGERVINAFEGWKTFEADISSLTTAELSDRLVDSPCSWLSNVDQDALYGKISKRHGLARQIFLEKRCRELFGTGEFGFVVTGAAARAVWTVPNVVARAMGIPAYRLFEMSYLNPRKEGARYWLAKDPFTRLSDDPRDSYGWEQESMDEHIRQLIEGVRTQSYRLDATARSFRGTFIPTNIRGFFRNVWGALTGNGRDQYRMQSYFNYLGIRQYYEQPENFTRRFLLYPLNMPRDEQLILRTPALRDIVSSCRVIANSLPPGVDLVIKEHPINPGSLRRRDLKSLLYDYDNIRICDPDVNIHELIKQCAGLITVNSTAAIDALAVGKPVLAFGTTWYRGSDAIYEVDDFAEFPKAIMRLLGDPDREGREEKLFDMIRSVLSETYPAPGVVWPKDDLNEMLSCAVEAVAERLKRFGWGGDGTGGAGSTVPRVHTVQRGSA